jgi:hypothetical protein
MENRPSGGRLMYVMSAVATPMIVDPRPKTKARMSFVETNAGIKL